MTLDELSDEEKCFLFTMGALYRLADEGVVKVGETLGLQPLGIALFDQLVASGFRPLVDEQRKCLLYLMSNDAVGDVEEELQ